MNVGSKIKVCDCIMGSGKTESAIAYMNEHLENKYVYITPYLDEAKRIRDGCPDLHFVEPSNKLVEYGFSKTNHTAHLISEGRNITTTHSAFKRYDEETLHNIQELGYVLIIDESVDVLEQYDIHPEDLRILIDSGYIVRDAPYYKLSDREYNGVAFKEVFRFLKARDLVEIDNEESGRAFYWALPPRLFTSFKEVYVLTYLFEGQRLCQYLKMNELPYCKIGVRRTDAGGYEFSDMMEYIPEYVKDLRQKIHILDNGKMNEVGDDRCSMSMNWFSRDTQGVIQLKKNLTNFFRNVSADVPYDERLWGGFSDTYGKLRGKGYSKCFLPFNARATNSYRNKTCLAYMANVYMNVGEKLMYAGRGCDIDEDVYALSVMLQWIWRSAIRDGRDITLYLPSVRMRELLVSWMNKVSYEYRSRKGDLKQTEWGCGSETTRKERQVL